MQGNYDPAPFKPMLAFAGKADCEATRIHVQLDRGCIRAICLPDTVKPSGQ